MIIQDVSFRFDINFLLPMHKTLTPTNTYIARARGEAISAVGLSGLNDRWSCGRAIEFKLSSRFFSLILHSSVGLPVGSQSAGDWVPETLGSNPAFSRGSYLISFRFDIISLLPLHKKLTTTDMYVCVYVCMHIYIYIIYIWCESQPEVERGVGILVSPCPSVRLFVCGQNRVRSVSSTILVRSISYCTSYQATSESVSLGKFCPNLKIWNVGKFFKFRTLTFSSFDFGSNMTQ